MNFTDEQIEDILLETYRVTLAFEEKVKRVKEKLEARLKKLPETINFQRKREELNRKILNLSDML